MAWWTRTKMSGVEKHATRLDAGITIRFAVFDGERAEDCGLYKQDPEKHPDAVNLLPAVSAKADRTMARRLASTAAKAALHRAEIGDERS